MNIAELKEAIVITLSAGLSPMISGSPGVGKSDLIRQVAASVNAEVIDIRLAQEDPTSLVGFPTHNGVRMGFAPPEHFPLQGLDEPPKGKAGWVLFLDEINSAPLAVQSAAYKLVLDRMVGKYHLHPKCAIVCAGNKESDGAIVNRMGTAMQSRLVHLELDVDVKSWINWATTSKLDHRVISYVESHPDHLHQFDPEHNDKTFSCPRTWEFTSKLIKDREPTPVLQQLLIGTLSAGIGHEFYAHMSYCSELPSIKDIINNPRDIEIPEEPALLYATSHMVAAYLDESNTERLMQYIDRLPLDFGVTAIRSALKRNKDLLQIESMRVWAHKIADEIF